MLSGKLFILVVVVGVSLADDVLKPFRNLMIPQDLGTPPCLFGSTPCTSEDYRIGSEYRTQYIKELVDRYTDEDIKVPACIKSKDCEKDVADAYEKEREKTYQEIYDQVKKANHLN